jgi:hypothetical protein
MCAHGVPSLRHSPSATWPQGVWLTSRLEPSAKCPTWFFFDSNNNFLKFFHDDNNNTNSSF